MHKHKKETIMGSSKKSNRNNKNRKLKRKGFFSGQRTLVFGIAFALIGSIFAYQAFAATNPLSGNGGEFHPLNPARLMDSRTGNGTARAALKAGETRTLQVSGRAGVHSTAVAAAVSITAVSPKSNGYLTAYPANKSRPNTSILNFYVNKNIANSTQIALSSDGKIKVYNGSQGTVHVVVDAEGYFVGTNGSNGLRAFRTVATRVLDTRSSSAIPARGYRDFNIQKSKLHPQTYFQDFEAVQVNLVAVNPSATGWLTAYPYGISKPNTSSLNYNAGQTTANATIVKVGSQDKIRVYNGGSSPVHVIGDISVAFRGRNESNSTLSGKFVAINPFRAFDSRSQNTKYSSGILSPGEYALVQVAGRGGVPSSIYGVTANLTTVGSTGGGYISSNWSTSTSLMNYNKGTNLANSMLTEILSGGTLIVGSGKGSGGNTHLIVDIMGYFK